MLVHPGNLPHVGQAFEAMLVWMAEQPMTPGKQYYLKHATKLTNASVRELRHRVNVNTLAHEPADRLALNEIGRVVMDLEQPVAFDPYRKNRATGAFVIIDRLNHGTVGAGMILERAEGGAGGASARSLLEALEESIRSGKPAEEQLNLLNELRRMLGQ
jgi:bifunctional enzyme CysN/CysC